MSQGITIAELVQQVYYAMYKVRLDVDQGVDGSYHSKTNKFKEVVMEANMVLQELQKDADWGWLRETWDMGHAKNFRGAAPQRIHIPDCCYYKICTGYGDSVRVHDHSHWERICEIPWTSPHTAKKTEHMMFGPLGEVNMVNNSQRAYVQGDYVYFARPWLPHEVGKHLETDVIRLIRPLHICTDDCSDKCDKAYSEKVLTDVPDVLYVILSTAARRAEGDPSITDMAQSLTDRASKLMSAMRENDSAHTCPDFYETVPLGYIEVL